MQEAIARKLLELGEREKELTGQYFNLLGQAHQIQQQIFTVQATSKELQGLIQNGTPVISE